MPRIDHEPLGPARLLCGRSTAENLTGNWRTFRPVIDASRCTGCLLCWKFCPESCVVRAEKTPSINLRWCKGCGICVEECPPGAISFEMEPEP